MIDNLTARETQKPASDRPVRSDGQSASRWRSAVIGAIIPIVILVAWNTVTVTGLVPAVRLRSPVDVVIAGIDLTASGCYATYIAISLQRVFLGFAIGSLLGLVLGAVVGLSRVGSWRLSPTMGGIRAVPSLAWVPLLTTVQLPAVVPSIVARLRLALAQAGLFLAIITLAVLGKVTDALIGLLERALLKLWG